MEEPRYKNMERDGKLKHQLQNRLNRILGQLGGIKSMIDDDRYCGDILIQIAAVEKALQGVGYIVLQNHMETCVIENIKQGNNEIIDETVELIKKLK